MSAAAMLAALALASPAAERFWDRDLGGLARVLAEERLAGPLGEESLLFEELSRLVRCEPLARLGPDAPDASRRLLLRIEEARRARLAAAAAESRTLWRDVLAPGFFRLASANPSPRPNELRWPAEREEWPDETLLVPDPVSRCARPGRAATAELPPAELVLALEREGRAAAAARAAYHRAVLLARAARANDAKTAAAEIDPAALDPALLPFARLLRLDLGLDPTDGWVALASDARLGRALVGVQVRAADLLARAGRTAEALAVAEAGAGEECLARRAPLVRALRFHRAVALVALGRRSEAGAALASAVSCRVPEPDPDAAALREVALSLAAALPPGDVPRGILEALSDAHARGDTFWAYGHRAVAAANWAAADDAADALASGGRGGVLRAHALRAEAAFARGDLAAFERAVAALLGAADGERDRVERDRLALDLARAAAVRAAEAPAAGRQHALEAALARIEEAAPLARGPDVARIREALRNASRALLGAAAKGAVPLALGEVAVAARAEVPPRPAIAFAYPEPFSLLVLPAPDGGERVWFPPDRVAEGSAR